MNKARRAELDKVLAILKEIEIDFGEARSLLEDAEGEEREGFDNLSEGLQASERAQAMEAAADALQEAMEAIDQASETVNEAVTQIEMARDGG